MNYLTFLKLLAANAPLIPTVAALASKFYAASSLVERWEVVKELGDALVPEFAKAPSMVVSKSFSAMTADEMADYEAEVEEVEQLVIAELSHMPAEPGSVMAQAWDGSRLKSIWNIVEPLLPLLLSLKG